MINLLKLFHHGPQMGTLLLWSDETRFSYNPDGLWANAHQMTINGKSNGITKEDFLAVAATQDIRNPLELIEQEEHGIVQFERYALNCGVPKDEVSMIKTIMDEKNPAHR